MNKDKRIVNGLRLFRSLEAAGEHQAAAAVRRSIWLIRAKPYRGTHCCGRSIDDHRSWPGQCPACFMDLFGCLAPPRVNDEDLDWASDALDALMLVDEAKVPWLLSGRVTEPGIVAAWKTAMLLGRSPNRKTLQRVKELAGSKAFEALYIRGY